MLTESCVMFFSPSRAVLSAILRDEYLTSAVRTKEGDKAGSNQPPARDPVQFKLELTPNYLISYLENTGFRSTRYVSIPHPNESSILRLQDQLSQHDRYKNLNQRHLRYARRFKSTSQRIATVGSSKPQGCGFELPTVAIRLIQFNSPGLQFDDWIL